MWRARLRALAILFAAVPFGFGLIRTYVTRGGDLRYLWVAFAALFGAAGLMQIAAPSGSGRYVAWLPAGVFLAATTCAAAAAWLLGTMAGAGMIIVAAGFGLCCAAASFFYQLAVSAP